MCTCHEWTMYEYVNVWFFAFAQIDEAKKKKNQSCTKLYMVYIAILSDAIEQNIHFFPVLEKDFVWMFLITSNYHMSPMKIII